MIVDHEALPSRPGEGYRSGPAVHGAAPLLFVEVPHDKYCGPNPLGQVLQGAKRGAYFLVGVAVYARTQKRHDWVYRDQLCPNTLGAALHRAHVLRNPQRRVVPEHQHAAWVSARGHDAWQDRVRHAVLCGQEQYAAGLDLTGV